MTTTHPMTPQQIAREAAEALYKELSEADPIKENERIARLILTAAAKMVRESGAIHALEQTTVFYAEDMPQGPEKADIYCVTKAYKDAYAAVLAALAQLRAIGEPRHEPPRLPG